VKKNKKGEPLFWFFNPARRRNSYSLLLQPEKQQKPRPRSHQNLPHDRVGDNRPLPCSTRQRNATTNFVPLKKAPNRRATNMASPRPTQNGSSPRNGSIRNGNGAQKNGLLAAKNASITVLKVDAAHPSKPAAFIRPKRPQTSSGGSDSFSLINLIARCVPAPNPNSARTIGD
jgi:hypothetical protein